MHTRSKPGTESQSLTLSIPATSFSQTELSIGVWIRYYCLKPARRARRKISQQSTLSPRKAVGSRHSAKGSKRLPLAVHLLAIQSLFPTLSESQLFADSCWEVHMKHRNPTLMFFSLVSISVFLSLVSISSLSLLTSQPRQTRVNITTPSSQPKTSH